MNDIYSKKTLSKLKAASFTYDNKTITVTHDMTLHITIPDGIDFQNILYKSLSNDKYFLELAHIIFTKLISEVPSTLTFKLYIFNIPSYMISYEFAKDAFDILKPLIFCNEDTMYTYKRYLIGSDDKDHSDDKESPFSTEDDDEE